MNHLDDSDIIVRLRGSIIFSVENSDAIRNLLQKIRIINTEAGILFILAYNKYLCGEFKRPQFNITDAVGYLSLIFHSIYFQKQSLPQPLIETTKFTKKRMMKGKQD